MLLYDIQQIENLLDYNNQTQLSLLERLKLLELDKAELKVDEELLVNYNSQVGIKVELLHYEIELQLTQLLQQTILSDEQDGHIILMGQ